MSWNELSWKRVELDVDGSRFHPNTFTVISRCLQFQYAVFYFKGKKQEAIGSRQTYSRKVVIAYRLIYIVFFTCRVYYSFSIQCSVVIF